MWLSFPLLPMHPSAKLPGNADSRAANTVNWAVSTDTVGLGPETCQLRHLCQFRPESDHISQERVY